MIQSPSPKSQSRSPSASTADKVPIRMAAARGAPPIRIGSVSERWSTSSNPSGRIRSGLHQQRKKTKGRRNSRQKLLRGRRPPEPAGGARRGGRRGPAGGRAPGGG